MTDPSQERPVHMDAVPEQEAVDAADAADRVDEDPAEQPNFTDTHPRGAGTETSE